ncbi:MAG: molybdate ABC transporter substrate-binding protein [Chloroflexi bacterium]|nr:molybdate ABC transporter substrate-binding protein [Chloroflexota bacterium]
MLAAVAATACSSGPDARDELLVFAAISLADALAEVKVEFDAEVRITVSYGGSQMLARQISKGAPADVFISAGEVPVRSLVEEGLVEAKPVSLLANKLVVVTRANGHQIETMGQLATGVMERIAMADPELAPAGAYAKESLISLGLWEQLEGKLLIGVDVRATLVYVQRGNADAALVYETDAASASDLRVLDIVPADSYSPVVYPVVIVARSKKKDQAAEFVELLFSDRARKIFLRHGFAFPEP